MAYNPFDDVILNDPAYMANGGNTQPYRAGQAYIDRITEPAVQENIARQSELMKSIVLEPVNLIGDVFANTLGVIAENMVNQEEAERGREKFETRREAAKMFNVVPQQLTPDQIRFFEQRTGKDVQRQTFKEGFNQTFDTLLRDAIDGSKAIREGANFTDLPGMQQIGVGILPLEFYFGGLGGKQAIKGINEFRKQHGGKQIAEVLNDSKIAAEFPEVIADMKAKFPMLDIGRDVTGARTTERFTDQDLVQSQMTAAEERGMRFLKGKSGEMGRPMVQQNRVDQVMPRIEQLSKTKGQPLTKKEILDELKKEFPDFKDQQIEGIYLNKKAPGPGQTAKSTFPFLKFMDESKAGSGYDPSLTAKQTNIKQAEEVQQRLDNFEQSLQSNPPTKVLTVKEAENLSGTKIKNINAYKAANPNSLIAKFVKDPQQKGVDQLTDDKIKLLEDEYEIFDDFVTPAQASRTTGIKPSTLNKLINKNEKNIQDLVQPRKVSGRERNFFSSYFSPTNQKSKVEEQTKYLLIYDAYRGGKFGDKKSFTKAMEEAGVTPKKILKEGEYVDNPNFLNTPEFIQANNINKETFINKLIDDLDEGRIGFEKLKELVKKRNDFTQHTKQRFLDLIGRNKKFRDVFIKEYREKIGNKFGGDVERQAIDFARVFSGNMAHVTPISKIRGRTPVRGDEFKLSPGLRGQFNNPEFYRVNLSVDNIALQPNFENVITKSVKQLNKQDRKGAAALRNIQRINQRMVENNQATLLEFSPKDMSDATVRFLQRKLGPQAVRFGKNKRQLFLGKGKDMSLQELKNMFDKRFAKYNLAPELFKISRQRPKGAKIADEDLVFGSAPYIRKNFILNFAEGGPVRMAIGGDPLQNINQQQFTPDPAFQGQDFFQDAVDSGNLTAFNPLRLFNLFGKTKGVANKTDVGQPTTLPRADQTVDTVAREDFPFQSFTYEKIISPNAPNNALPQDWANFLLGGNQAPVSEIRDSGLEQFLSDFEKYYPGRKVSKEQLAKYYETSPVGNLSVTVKQEPTPNVPNQGRPKHKETGSQPLDGSGENYREVLVTAGEIPGEGKPFVNSAHFEEPNVIAFTRVADYKLADGSTAAVIQELQTDMLTSLRTEQQRIKALLKRLENAEDEARRKMASADNYERARGEQDLRAIESVLTPQAKELLIQSEGIKPFPNAAGQELIPGYSQQLGQLQKQIDDILAKKLDDNMPFIDEDIFGISQQQLKIRDQLLDLNRALETDSVLGDVRVPPQTQADDLLRFSESTSPPRDYDLENINLFPPVPFKKAPDFVDLIIKATIKDAQSKGINNIGLFTGELVNRRWGKDPTGPAGKKFNDLYDKIGVQQLNNIAKKYGGQVVEGEIVDPSKATKGIKISNKGVDGEFELLKDFEPRAVRNPDEVQEFLNTEIERIALDYAGTNLNNVVLRREIAPGQTMEYYVKIKQDDGFELVPLGDGDRAENATIIIDEYNPSLIKIPVLKLPVEEKARGPLFLYRKKDGGKIASDGLVSITDIYGDY